MLYSVVLVLRTSIIPVLPAVPRSPVLSGVKAVLFATGRHRRIGASPIRSLRTDSHPLKWYNTANFSNILGIGFAGRLLAPWSRGDDRTRYNVIHILGEKGKREQDGGG